MPDLGVNVDLDRIKFLSRQNPNLDKALETKTRLLVVEVVGVKYYSWIVAFCELAQDEAYRKDVKATIEHFYQKETCIFFSGNGLEANKNSLGDLFGQSKLEGFKRYSQVSGIIEGLRILIGKTENSPYFYRLKPQSLLDVKAIKYSPEVELPSDVKFPTLVVNIKGGVTFYRLDSLYSKPIKVLASIFGEFSLSGLIKLFTDKFPGESLNQIIKRALLEGSNLKVDLTVGDIYGEGIGQVAGLHKDIIASSLGKTNASLEGVSDLDYIAGAIVMFAINVSNISSLVVSSG